MANKTRLCESSDLFQSCITFTMKAKGKKMRNWEATQTSQAQKDSSTQMWLEGQN